MTSFFVNFVLHMHKLLVAKKRGINAKANTANTVLAFQPYAHLVAYLSNDLSCSFIMLKAKERTRAP